MRGVHLVVVYVLRVGHDFVYPCLKNKKNKKKNRTHTIKKVQEGPAEKNGKLFWRL